ncbi:MAG TPA: ABC transporter substrate-binding protein [Mycobacteriales bacterium]|nr:ABC transporter substrate-binding protein [Mycobacteriales bacterium]
MRTPRAAVLVMMAGLIATACGARLPADVQTKAQSAVLNPNTGSSGVGTTTGGSTDTTGGVDTTGGGTTTTGGTGTTGSGTTTGGTGTTGSGTTAGGHGTKPGTTQTQAAGPACGKGTDVGLTASDVTIGTIADVTGPVSGLFQGAQQGMLTFANFINQTQGGICGHHVNVAFRDGGTNCTQTQNAASDLVNKVFAFVGSFALYDNCAASVLQQHPTVPDIHDSLDPAAGKLSNHFDIEPGELGYASGPFEYFKQKYGDKVLHVGTIAEDLSSALAKQHAIVHAAESAGWKFVYSQNEQPTNSNFQQDFVTMCSRKHIQIFFTVTENAQNAATMIQNENQAGCPKTLINIIPIAYDQAFLDAFKGNTGAIENLQGYNQYAMFFNPEDGAQIPELKLFQEWFQRTYPNQPANLYAMFAWASGRLFQQAMENAGPTLNRKTVLAALHKIKNFDANGMISPETPSSKSTGVHCYILWQFKDGKFQRQADPPISGPTKGYRCDGRFVPAS